MTEILKSVGGMADKVVGDVILGGLGQGAYYLGQVPGLNKALNYVGENIRDGYNKAESRHQKTIATRLVTQLTTAKRPPSADEIRQACVDAGITEENLLVVEHAVDMRLKAMAESGALIKGIGEERKSANSPSREVPLPRITGEVIPSPAVG